MKIELSCFVGNSGKIITDNEALKKGLQSMLGKTGILTIETGINNISHNQRKYFFGVIVEILYSFFKSQGNNYEKEDIIDYLKEKFINREKYCPITGKIIRTHISLSNQKNALNQREFNEIKETIQRWAIEVLDIEIPDPDKNWKMYAKT